jgi:hypothetical protein
MVETTEPSRGRIRAATELVVPPAGFTAPHRLALVDAADGHLTVAIVEGSLPDRGAEGNLRTDTEGRLLWRATP